ncbi:YaaR family protein [Bacillus sp. FJAT-50079]|uniref:YaaR family protein n=1 Tax=Bacillus sp. FJAT-50079 TaxID=2833577 RepID=UPI001BC8F31C|nr:YaaR family protein [Bacillus sp. FJAT-50079]MBS4208283.1 YaaR family protein [Bacillus sp. FJAT-50079]
MDVRRIVSTGVHAARNKTQQATESVHFTEVMAKKRENIIFERMDKLRQEIEQQGEKLAKSQTIEDFRKYKQLVKSFMEDAVNNGLQLQEQRGFDWRGRTKVYKIVKEVDKKLIDLANSVLDKEKKGLDLLGLIGEIEGLLINIYT